MLFTEEDTTTYNQTKDLKNKTVACVICRKTIAMTVECRIGFGFYQCQECGEKEKELLATIKH